jgi:hypothetical protein
VIAAIVGPVVFGPNLAHAVTCTYYTLDCTNPSTAQSGATKSCAYYATTVRSATVSNGPSFVNVDLRYSSGGSGAACGTAWSRASSWACSQPGGLCNSSNPVMWVIRTTPSAVNTSTLAGLGTFSKQLVDCCGGFAAKAAGQILTSNGNAVTSAAVTTTY